MKAQLDAWGVNYDLEPGWNTSRIDPYNGASIFRGVVLHHTAGRDSLRYIVSGNPYAPVRACHFYVKRNGGIVVVSGVGAYHAGKGGPMRIGDKSIPRDSGNRYLYGIEIESLGTSAKIDGSPEGMAIGQVIGTAKLCAALTDAIGRPSSSLVIRHKDWTDRKVDTRQSLAFWRKVTDLAIANKGKRQATGDAIKAYVATTSYGR